jgi:hypothetical protein
MMSVIAPATHADASRRRAERTRIPRLSQLWSGLHAMRGHAMLGQCRLTFDVDFDACLVANLNQVYAAFVEIKLRVVNGDGSLLARGLLSAAFEPLLSAACQKDFRADFRTAPLERFECGQVADGYLPIVGVEVTLGHSETGQLGPVVCDLVRRHHIHLARHRDYGLAKPLRRP